MSDGVAVFIAFCFATVSVIALSVRAAARARNDRWAAAQVVTQERLSDDELMVTLRDGRTLRSDCGCWYLYPSGERIDAELEDWIDMQMRARRWSGEADDDARQENGK